MNLQGNPVSQGIAVGQVFCYTPFVPVVEEGTITQAEVASAIARYESVREAAGVELEKLCQSLKESHPDKAKIFTAHLDILFDIAMDEEVRTAISSELLAPDWAVSSTYDQYARLFSKSKTEVIRERAADMKDVKNRLLRLWAGVPEENLAALAKPVVVVTHDLFPSDTATLDRQNVLAIVTEVGGFTSHSAIIARSYQIPALLGVDNAMGLLSPGQTVIVDALKGLLLPQPTPVELEEYSTRREDFLSQRKETERYLPGEARTADGTRIDLDLNIGAASAQELAGSDYVDGVGLFRTEFVYLGKPQLPTEEEQFQIYKEVLLRFGTRPVTLRTLDIGGDKKLDCMELPQEENPFLGNRALRLCFQQPEIFRTQLRAALRASVYGNLWLMFPMVGSLDDLRRAKAFVAEAKEELTAQGIAYSPDVKVGIMVEIPSIALLADLAAQEADFASIGTNDLTQYTMAADRMNPATTAYYQSFNPAVFRLMGYVAKQFNGQGKPICVCGELGGNCLAAPVLLGLGIRKLSMSLTSVAAMKKTLSHLTISQGEALAKAVCGFATAAEVEAYLKEKREGEQ